MWNVDDRTEHIFFQCPASPPELFPFSVRANDVREFWRREDCGCADGFPSHLLWMIDILRNCDIVRGGMRVEFVADSMIVRTYFSRNESRKGRGSLHLKRAKPLVPWTAICPYLHIDTGEGQMGQRCGRSRFMIDCDAAVANRTFLSSEDAHRVRDPPPGADPAPEPSPARSSAQPSKSPTILLSRDLAR
jgi:hypothetical protein